MLCVPLAFSENLSKANSDVVLVDYAGIDSIIDPLTLFMCSDKCNWKFLQFTFAGVDKFTKTITKLNQVLIIQ